MNRADTRGARRAWRPEHGLAVLVPFACVFGLSLVGVPLCATKGLTGIPCPGCGLTRATLALLTLEPASALAAHPLVVVVIPMIGWAAVRAVLETAGGGTATATRVPPVPGIVWATLAVLLLGVWAIRLAGMGGGLPDPVDPSRGWIVRTWRELKVAL